MTTLSDREIEELQLLENLASSGNLATIPISSTDTISTDDGATWVSDAEYLRLSGATQSGMEHSVITPRYEVGKWYKATGWRSNTYCKFDGKLANGMFGFSESIYTSYSKQSGAWGKSADNIIQEVTLEEIEPYLPEGHPDKIKVIKKPEEVVKPKEDIVAKMLIEHFGEDRVDIVEVKYGSEEALDVHFYSSSRKLNRVIIYYPELTIENNSKEVHNVKDLYVCLYYQPDNSKFLDYFYGTRTTVNYLEKQVGYQHSHVSTGNRLGAFGGFCRGSGDLAIRLLELSKKFSESDFELFLYCIDNYVIWEDLKTKPHIYFKQIYTDSTTSSDSYDYKRPSEIKKAYEGLISNSNSHDWLKYFKLNSNIYYFAPNSTELNSLKKELGNYTEDLVILVNSSEKRNITKKAIDDIKNRRLGDKDSIIEGKTNWKFNKFR